jgi:xanthine dehydrogenase YagS FAD-binding subunit
VRPFVHVNAASIKRAVALLSANESSRIIAGGTDLIPELKLGIAAPERLVGIKTIPGLNAIRFDASGGLKLGAVATLNAAAENASVRERYPLLFQAISSAATLQLRNVGTIGGNLGQHSRCWYYRGRFHCWLKGGTICYAAAGENGRHVLFGGGPCHSVHPSDVAPALVALKATVRIAGEGGDRTLPVEDIFQRPKEGDRNMLRLAPSDIMLEVNVPVPAAETRGTYRKAMERQVWTFASVSVAAQLHLEAGVVREARLALGGVAPFPWRVVEAENGLTGRRLDDDTIGLAADAAVAGARPLKHNGYKIPLAKAMVKEALESLRSSG